MSFASNYVLMTIQPAPALLVGLGARILLDIFNNTEGPTVKDHILLGVWQGVALHYAIKNSNLGFLVITLIACKLIFEFNIYPDVNRCASTVIGVLLGFLGTDLISQFVYPQITIPVLSPTERRRRKVSFSTPGTREDKKRLRVAQIRAHHHHNNNNNNNNHAQANNDRDRPLLNYHPVSDITSIDSNSDLIRAQENMTPLEREIAALRARASLADSERRRCREERKWALSEGNLERAGLLKQQVKRYTALMQGFHREADTKIIQEVKNTSQTNLTGDFGDGPRADSMAPRPESQSHVRKSSFPNGHTNLHASSSSSWDPKPGPSRRVTAQTAPIPILIRRNPTR